MVLSLDYLRSFCQTDYSLLAFQFASNFVVFLRCGPEFKSCRIIPIIRNNYINLKGLDQVVLPESSNKPLTTILIMHHTLIVSLGMNANITEPKTGGLARLILETADSEHIEMYLKAIWRIAKKCGLVKKRDGSD